VLLLVKRLRKGPVMISTIALVIAIVALVAAVGLGGGAARREATLRSQGARLDRLERGAELAVRDVHAAHGALLLTLVNVGRGESHQATVVAATPTGESARVEVGALPPVRKGHPGTVVELPLAAADAPERHSLWLRIGHLDDLGYHRTSLLLAPEAVARVTDGPVPDAPPAETVPA
jgi:hypothetical protein